MIKIARKVHYAIRYNTASWKISSNNREKKKKKDSRQLLIKVHDAIKYNIASWKISSNEREKKKKKRFAPVVDAEAFLFFLSTTRGAQCAI